MSRIDWQSEKGRLLQEQALVCHPMHYEGSEGDERECEDHDGFFEPWSREKLEISLSNRLEITVAFLAVKKSDIPGKRTLELPDKLLGSWNLTENKILDWANSWWTHGKKEYIPKFIPYPKPLRLPEEETITIIKENCKLVVELTEEAGSVTGRFGYSVFDEERAQLTLNLKDRKEEYRKHTVIHEFGHVLGLKHEHQRSDFWQGIYRFTDFNTIACEQFSERKETKGAYDDYTTYDPLSVMHYFWRLEYFKKQFRQWFEPQSTRKIEIAKKRLNLEISATEEMVLMSICDQLHKVKTLKCFIESKGESNNHWVLATQLEPRNKDVPLPSKPGDIPEKGVKAWFKLANGRLKSVTIHKVEYVAGSTDNGSHHINDAYKFAVKPSTKDIKLANWAYNTNENKPPRPYSLPKPPLPVVRPVHPASTTTKGPPAGSIHFMIRLEPFDGSYGDLGDFKAIVITGNPVKYNLAPTETQIPDKVLPKANGQSKTKERVSVVHTGDARKLLVTQELVINEVANPSVQLDEDDCYYIFIRLYAPSGKIFRDSATIPLFELKSVEKARLCYENLKKRAKSEIESAMFSPRAILSENDERDKLKEEVLAIFEKVINLPESCMEKYQLGPRNETFVQQLVRAMDFLLLFRGRNDLPFQLVDKIGLISSDLKSDIAVYKAACEVEKFKAVEVAFKEHHSVDNSDDSPIRSWRFCCDESFRKAIPYGYSKLRVTIEIDENRYLFESLMKLGRTLSGGKRFYTHEMYTSEREASNLWIIFLMPLIEDKDVKKAFRDKVQSKFISEIKIKEIVLISRDNRETITIYSHRTQPDTARRYRKRARKVSTDSEQEGMLSLLSSMKKHSVRKTRIEADSAEDGGMESPMSLVLRHAPNWKAIARTLGLSDNRVKRIESDYLQPERCLRVTIWKWLHNNKWKSDGKIPKPSFDNLKTVIEKVSTA